MLTFFLVYLSLSLLYLERKQNYKFLLMLISASSKTSKNRNAISNKIEKVNKEIRLFPLWPFLSLLEVINDIKRNRSRANKT